MAFSKLAVLALLTLRSASVFAAEQEPSIGIAISFPGCDNDSPVLYNNQDATIYLNITNNESTEVTLVNVFAMATDFYNPTATATNIYRLPIAARSWQKRGYIFRPIFDLNAKDFDLILVVNVTDSDGDKHVLFASQKDIALMNRDGNSRENSQLRGDSTGHRLFNVRNGGPSKARRR